MSKVSVINPATEEIIAKLNISTKEDVDKAVEKARIKFEEWKHVPYEEKAEMLKKISAEIQDNKKNLTELLTKEMGKTLKESESEVESTVKRINFFADNVKDFIEPEEIDIEGQENILYFEPIGTVGIITPWNFPFSLPVWSFAPNILIGNTMVFKPSELTSLIGIELVKIFNKHLPKDVLNIVIGEDETGKALVASDVDMIAFVGSQNAGKNIMKNSAEKLHKLVLELGGKDPAIVCEDADLDVAVEGIADGSFRNCGQVCCSIEKVYVVKDIFDEFVKKAVERTKEIKVGNGLDSGVDIGPLISKGQLENFESHIKDAVNKGAKILCGGNRIKSKGYFFEPTVLADVNNTMKIMAEETFGPAMPIQAVEDVDEAVKLSNDTVFGLGASVWSKDIEKAKKITRKLEAGSVGINKTVGSNSEIPWGGVKQSGLGRMLSKYGVREFTNIKNVSRDL
jgi:acyl-CoA reductase-like NAD-dependent aldehyde dehydrogenase